MIQDLVNVLRVPGRLCMNPTSLSGSYPWGGTALGVNREISVSPMARYAPIEAEEFGQEIIDQVYLGEQWMLGFILQSYDRDAVTAFFRNSVLAGQGSSQKPAIRFPHAGVRAGTLLSGTAKKLLFSPDDTDNHPMVYFPRALPMVKETAALNMMLNSPTEIALVVAAIRDTTNRAAIVERKATLTL